MCGWQCGLRWAVAMAVAVATCTAILSLALPFTLDPTNSQLLLVTYQLIKILIFKTQLEYFKPQYNIHQLIYNIDLAMASTLHFVFFI